MMLLLSILFLLALGLYLWWNRSALHVSAAHRAFRRGDETAALAAFVKAEAAGRLNADITASYAYLLLKNGHIDDAGTLLDRSLRHGRRGKPLQEKEKRLLQTYQALFLWKNGRVGEAVELLEGLHETGYRTMALYGNLGFFLLEQGDLQKAETICSEAAEWASDGKVILDNLGTLHLKKKEWDKAAEVYGRLLVLEPKFPEAWWGAGRAAFETGDRDAARSHWEKALTFPFNALTTVEKGEIEKALSSL